MDGKWDNDLAARVGTPFYNPTECNTYIPHLNGDLNPPTGGCPSAESASEAAVQELGGADT